MERYGIANSVKSPFPFPLTSLHDLSKAQQSAQLIAKGNAESHGEF